MEFTWIISAMDCKVAEGEMTDVVHTIHWRYNATDVIEEKQYFVETYGATCVGDPTPENFTQYSDLTKEQVVGWLEEVLDIEQMQENLSNQIEQKVHPIDITLPPPF